MEINIQGTIEVSEDQLDQYILQLENHNIHVDQYTQYNKRVIYTSLDEHKDILILIFNHMNMVDIYTSLTNHVNEIIMKET